MEKRINKRLAEVIRVKLPEYMDPQLTKVVKNGVLIFRDIKTGERYFLFEEFCNLNIGDVVAVSGQLYSSMLPGHYTLTNSELEYISEKV